jgi:DNA mismatch endonuclease, patch repair protein
MTLELAASSLLVITDSHDVVPTVILAVGSYLRTKSDRGGQAAAKLGGRNTSTTVDSWASSQAVREVMRANRKRDTGPELRLRSQLHLLGLRYRLGRRIKTSPPVMPDLVFPVTHVAVFVDGCFWHGCPAHGFQPRTNASYWARKIALNRIRDGLVDRKLLAIGWRTVRVWEHDDPARAATSIKVIVRTIGGKRGLTKG